MKKYFFFFRNRFYAGLQYRAASVTALVTHFIWGIMECAAFKILLESNDAASPMALSSIISYIWLKEAFFDLFNTWGADRDIFNLIVDGGIAYEMCRPVSVYNMWFAKNIGGRAALSAIGCVPVMAAAMLLPEPYRLIFPAGAGNFFLFLLTMFLGAGVTVSFCMLVYISAFFTISPQGMKMILTGAVEFLAGSVIPLPFIPNPYRRIMELLPFASMQNVPLRIYSGDLCGYEMWTAILLQIFWLVSMVLVGKAVCRRAERRVVVQGG